MNTPIKIAMDAFLISNSKRDAIKAPVQAPVPGKGIPTNRIKKINSPFDSPVDFLAALSSNFNTSPFKILCFFISAKIFLINNKINGIGSIFPNRQIIFALNTEISKREAIITPPRSSIKGNIETKKTNNSFGRNVPNE